MYGDFRFHRLNCKQCEMAPGNVDYPSGAFLAALCLEGTRLYKDFWAAAHPRTTSPKAKAMTLPLLNDPGKEVTKDQLKKITRYKGDAELP